MDSDAGQPLLIFIMLIFFIILKAFFTVCEHAITEINDSKVASLAAKDGKYAQLLNLITSPSQMITAFSIMRAVLGVFIAVESIRLLYHPLLEFTQYVIGLRADISEFLSIILISLLSAAVIVVFTDTIPRLIAKGVKDSFAVKAVRPVKFLIAVLKPFSVLTGGISLLFCKLFRIPVSDAKNAVTEEEILMMVQAGNENGIIEESQRTMINNIFEFGDMTVSEAMTHRTELAAVDVNSDISEVVEIARDEGFSRIPVYDDSIDNIVGVIYIKDLLCLIGYEKIDDFTISQFMRQVMYVPETAKCKNIFETMTLKKTQVAVVLDEYGGTAGIITMEDLLEVIVGNIQDEYDDEADDLIKIDENVYMIDGAADPDDILPRLEIPMPENRTYNTMSSLFVDILGRIPREDENPSVTYKNLEMNALIVEDNLVRKIKARIVNYDETSNQGD